MKLIHERIADYAASFPAKAAVTDPRGEISYGEMETQSAAISGVLSSLGVGTGDAVAVYVPYSKEILLGAVSVFRTGAVFVPFDFEYPEERLAYMLQDSDAKAILTLRDLWEQKPLRFPADQVIFMDEQYNSDQKSGCYYHYEHSCDKIDNSFIHVYLSFKCKPKQCISISFSSAHEEDS